MLDQRIQVGNVRLQIREYAQDDEAVIFLHFGGGNLVMWQGVVPYFKEDYHLILVDLRGHGKSDKPGSGYHMDQMAQDVIQVMKQLGIERAHVVGSSLGAEVGLSMAANHPGKVLSLVCEGALFNEYGPYGLWEGTEEAFKEHVASTMEKIRENSKEVFTSVDALVEDSRQNFEPRGWWSDIFESVVRYDAIKLADDAYAGSWGKMAEVYMTHYFNYRLEDYYKGVKCPLLMMPDTYPGQDEREKTVMQGLFKLVERGKIVSVPEWVHPFGWMITPQEGSKAVLEFLDEIR